MKALSLQQPWAYFLAAGIKDVENRKWHTKFRGEFLIHASRKYDHDGAVWIHEHFPELIWPVEGLKTGGVIGKAKVIDCVDNSLSPWFMGPVGFIVSDAELLPFQPCRGMLNFFEIDYH